MKGRSISTLQNQCEYHLRKHLPKSRLYRLWIRCIYICTSVGEAVYGASFIFRPGVSTSSWNRRLLLSSFNEQCDVIRLRIQTMVEIVIQLTIRVQGCADLVCYSRGPSCDSSA